MWEWLASIKGETWGAFAGGLVVFVLRVIGPALAKYATTQFRKKAQELEALSENEKEAVLETEKRRLQIELGLARRDLDDAGEDLRRMANALAVAERERDAWKQRAVSLAREAGLVKEDEGARKDRQRPDAARPTHRPRAPGADAAWGVDRVPTLPPRKPDP